MKNLDTLFSKSDKVPFHDFMEWALYSEQGYYQKHVKIGASHADFWTASLSPFFAMTLARVIWHRWQQWHCPSPIQVVEWGAGQGELALGILAELVRSGYAIQMDIHYVIYERSVLLRRLQKKRLKDWWSVQTDSVRSHLHLSWANPDLHIPTILVANEVLDALPVERLKRTEGGHWLRSYVQRNTRGFSEIWDIAQGHLAALADRWLPIPIGQIGELSPDIQLFFQPCTTFTRELYGLFFDYGIRMADLENGLRPEGTLRAYHQHQLVHPLQQVGHIDMTADVHWDLVMSVAEKNHFNVLNLYPQGQFLIEQGILEIAENLQSTLEAKDDMQRFRWMQSLKTLIMPGAMGERFEVLVCERNAL